MYVSSRCWWTAIKISVSCWFWDPKCPQIMTHWSRQQDVIDSRRREFRAAFWEILSKRPGIDFSPWPVGSFLSQDLHRPPVGICVMFQFHPIPFPNHWKIIPKIIVKIMDYSSNSSEISWNSTFRQLNCRLIFKTSKVLPWLRGVWNRCICWNPWNWVSWPVHLIFTSRCLGRHYILQRLPNSQRFFHLRSVKNPFWNPSSYLISSAFISLHQPSSVFISLHQSYPEVLKYRI